MSLLLVLLMGVPPAVEAFTSTAEVRACQPLAEGRVLAATTGGLVLYGPDLEPERIWTSLDPSLPGTDVRALAASEDGSSAWVGGPEGIARLRRDDRGAWDLQPLALVGHVGSLLRDGDRLFAGAARGLVVVDVHDGAAQRFDLPHPAGHGPAQFVISLAWSPAGLHLGTSGDGLWTWNGSDLKPSPANLPSPYVHALGAANGRVLAGTVGGLVDVGRSAPIATAQVRALLRIDGGWLAGTMGEGLIRLDDATGGQQRIAFPARDVTALGAGRGTTCVGTTEGTFVRQGRGPWRQARVTGPPSNDVTALALDGARLWVGTFDRGLGVYESGAWRAVAGPDERVNGLALEPGGKGSRLWVATARGLASIDQGAVRVRRVTDGLPSDDVHAVATLRAGGALVGTARGAAIVRDGRIETLVKTGAPAEATWAVAEGADGSLWLGTTNGLYRYRRGAPIRRFSVAGGELWDNWVTSIVLDGASVWVGTYAGGVSHLTLGPTNVSAEPWAGNAHVNPAGLSVHDGVLWAATMEGTMTLRLKGGDGAWRRTRGDAPGPDVTAVVQDGTWRWVASRNGLSRWSLP